MSKKRTWLVIGVIMVSGLALIGALTQDAEQRPAEARATRAPTAAPTPVQLTQNAVCHAAERQIESVLKAPHTRKWVGTCYNGAGYQFTQATNELGLPVWTVRGQVDSENSFGAMIRSTWQVTIIDLGASKYTAQVDWFE